MEFNVGKVGINLGGWYRIFLGDKGSLSVYTSTRCLQASQLMWSKTWHSSGKGRHPFLDIYWRTEEEL